MKLFLKLFFTSLLLSLLLAILRGGYISVFSVTGVCLSSIVGFIVLGGWSIFNIYRYKAILNSGYVIMYIYLGVSVLEIGLRMRDFSGTFISFPSLVIWWLGILSGYLLTCIPKKIGKVSFVIVALVAVYWLSIPGYKIFLHYLNFGTFTGITHQEVSYPLVFRNSKGELVTFTNANHAYVVLDFWNSSCGACFQVFPELQKMYEKNRGTSGLSFYSIHCYMADKGEGFETGRRILQEKNYAFPCLSLDITDEILDSLKVKCYPTILILDSCNNIIFRGNIESVANKVQEITNVKNE